MLIRISLIVAILASLAATGIGFFTLQEKINATIKERDEWNGKFKTESSLRIKADRLAKDTQDKLDKTTKELAAAVEDKNKAVADAAEKIKAAAQLADQLKATEQKLATKDAELARWLALQIPIEKALEILTSVKRLTEEKSVIEQEKAIVYSQYVKVKKELDDIKTPGTEIPLPEYCKGKVIAVDPKFDFVVLDVGEKLGAQAKGKLLVSHNGTLVAQVRIAAGVEASRCIANVIPGCKYGEIMEGDVVIAAVIEQ